MMKRSLFAAASVTLLCGSVAARTFKNVEELNAWTASEQNQLAYLLAESLCAREIRSLSMHPQSVKFKREPTLLPPTSEGGVGSVHFRAYGKFGLDEDARGFIASCIIRSQNGQSYSVEGLTFMPDPSQ